MSQTKKSNSPSLKFTRGLLTNKVLEDLMKVCQTQQTLSGDVFHTVATDMYKSKHLLANVLHAHENDDTDETKRLMEIIRKII